ncbi:hypothetical protein OAF98_03240 [Planctomicrobium sp.]|nr:hydantoinase/oxoprolinase family protein [Planctomicrobium sp.]MBT5018489.1 H4MPT-linked C1 transfer pathway protein [Planctomicrobium sp.]MDB4743477.1 hypothetical protein [Planctomicrobium sp.]MDB4802590.1 H4MPT-linked C1 transfer pathway protein [bacterium]
MSVVGIDIGGANLKASDGKKSVSRPFPLWKEPENLADEISRLLSEFHPYGPVAATTTGELADCFRTRSEGVREIVSAIQTAAPKRQIAIWQTGGEFLTADEAIELPELVAAANWHALATWAGRACPQGLAILLDIGSTTTDIIPIDDGFPVPQGTTDLARLCSGELVYQGTRRTPLCAVTKEVGIYDSTCPLAAELFATTFDIALILGDVKEQPENFETANSRSATKEDAQHRLARMLCSDCEQISATELQKITRQIRDCQLETLSKAFRKVLTAQEKELAMIILSGEGEYLARRMLDQHFNDLSSLETISLNTILSNDHSEAACAYALAKLGTERL